MTSVAGDPSRSSCREGQMPGIPARWRAGRRTRRCTTCSSRAAAGAPGRSGSRTPGPGWRAQAAAGSSWQWCLLRSPGHGHGKRSPIAKGEISGINPSLTFPWCPMIELTLLAAALSAPARPSCSVTSTIGCFVDANTARVSHFVTVIVVVVVVVVVGVIASATPRLTCAMALVVQAQRVRSHFDAGPPCHPVMFHVLSTAPPPAMGVLLGPCNPSGVTPAIKPLEWPQLTGCWLWGMPVGGNRCAGAAKRSQGPSAPGVARGLRIARRGDRRQRSHADNRARGGGRQAVLVGPGRPRRQPHRRS